LNIEHIIFNFEGHGSGDVSRGGAEARRILWSLVEGEVSRRAAKQRRFYWGWVEEEV
jgi:hypothetical protein